MIYDIYNIYTADAGDHAAGVLPLLGLLAGLQGDGVVGAGPRYCLQRGLLQVSCHWGRLDIRYQMRDVKCSLLANVGLHPQIQYYRQASAHGSRYDQSFHLLVSKKYKLLKLDILYNFITSTSPKFKAELSHEWTQV